MSLNHLKSKIATLELQMGLLKKQVEDMLPGKTLHYKTLLELKGVWKSDHLTNENELKAVEMDIEKNIL